MDELKQEKLNAFLSYSHADEAAKKSLMSRLRKLKNVAIWNDRELLPGDHVDREISKHLNESQIIILLLSENSLNSYYCYKKELRSAIKREKLGKCTVIPVVLSFCNWKLTGLEDYLGLPQDGKPIYSYTETERPGIYKSIVDGIKRKAEFLIDQAAKRAVEASSSHLKQLPMLSKNGRGIKLELPIKNTITFDASFFEYAKHIPFRISNMQTMITKTISQIGAELKNEGTNEEAKMILAV